MTLLSRSSLAIAACTLLASGGTSHAGAQQPAAPRTTRSYVVVVRLKPEMVTEWMDLQRNEVIPAQKKAGVASRTTLVTTVGNAFEYSTITPFPAFAAMDSTAPLARALGADGAAALNAKIRKCILTQTSYMVNRQDDLTVDPGTAPVWRIAVRKMQPGKNQEYLSWVKTDILPGMQKAKAAGKIAGYTVNVRGVGAQVGEFTTITYYSKFADLDGPNPLIALLGQDAVTKINDRNQLLSTATQTIIRRRLPDLSF